MNLVGRFGLICRLMVAIGIGLLWIPPAPIRAQQSVEGTIAYVQDGNIYLVDLATGVSTALTDDGVVAETGESSYTDLSWSPDGETLVFAANFSGNYDLYSMRPNGEDVQRLTQTPENERFPLVTPDRDLIFARQYPDPITEGPSPGLPTEIIQRDVGGLETILYQQSGFITSLSLGPNDQLAVAFRVCCGGFGEGFVINRRAPGQAPQPIASMVDCPSSVYEVAWHERQLALLGAFCLDSDVPTNGIYLVDMTTQAAPTPLYVPGLAFLFGLDWSPDGRWLSVGIHGTDAAPSVLYLIDAATGDQSPLAAGSIFSQDAAWRPTLALSPPPTASPTVTPTIRPTELPSPTNSATATASPTSTPPPSPSPTSGPFFLCVGPGECGSMSAQGGTAGIVVADVTLSDTLHTARFPVRETTSQLKQNTLWLQVTNDGSDASPITPYWLVVSLKQGTTLIEQQLFKREAPIQALNPGQIVTIKVDNVFFFHVVPDGQLDVEFIPMTGGTAGPSWVGTKPITVEKHTDTICECVVDIAQGLLSTLGAGAPVAAQTAFSSVRGLVSQFDYTGLGLAAIKAGCTGQIGNFLKDAATWLVGELLGAFDGVVAEAIMPTIDATRALAERSIPCLKLKDWLIALTHEWLFHGVDLRLVLIESPVYPLVINGAGQRTGFLSDGTMVEEIPDTYALLLGEKRAILYTHNPAKLELYGYAPGTMNVYATVMNEAETSTIVEFTAVPVQPGMKVILDPASADHVLMVDSNGDGTTEHTVAPNARIMVVGRQAPETTMVAQGVEPQPPSSSYGGAMIGFGILGACVLLALGVFIGRRMARSSR